MGRLENLSIYIERFFAAARRLGDDPHAQPGSHRRARAWMETGATADDAALWEHHGLTPEQARPYIDRDVDPMTYDPEEPPAAYGDRPEDYVI